MGNLSTRLDIPHTITFANAVTNIAKESSLYTSDAFLGSKVAALSETAAALTVRYKSDKKLSPLAEADGVRDEWWSKLGAMLRGYLAVPLETYTQKAELLYALYQKYGAESARKDFASQSADIDSFVIDAGTGEIKTAAQALPGVTEAIEALAEAERTFKALNTAYNAALVAEKQQESAYSLKLRLFEIINRQLFPYIEAMQIANPDAYGDLYARLENERKRANASVSRSKKSTSAATESSPSES